MPATIAEPEPVRPAADPGLKPVRVELPDDVHRQLRMLAAAEGVSMAHYARTTLERIVREEFQRHGLK